MERTSDGGGLSIHDRGSTSVRDSGCVRGGRIVVISPANGVHTDIGRHWDISHYYRRRLCHTVRIQGENHMANVAGLLQILISCVRLLAD